MTDKPINLEQDALKNRTISNPADREALKSAADDYLQSRKADLKREAEEAHKIEIEVDNVAAKLSREKAELKDQYLRLAAEMENLRRRTARDVADARNFAVSNFARDMLNIADDLQRALASTAQGEQDLEAKLKSLIDGVELTERSLLATLERHGVKKIEAEGQKFDPNFHQAMFEIPDTQLPHNTVQQVVQAGYMINERVLRPAMVGVAKGGPLPSAE